VKALQAYRAEMECGSKVRMVATKLEQTRRAKSGGGGAKVRSSLVLISAKSGGYVD
jgi:hypothetical protein